MSYFTVLGLNREPFSTSPDPEFFYESSEHHAALVKVMIEIRLRRGLSLLVGDVGTGKTTLSRKFSLMLKEREGIIFHLMLDPACETEELFLESLIRTFKIEIRESSCARKGYPNILDFKEAIKKYLFTKGVEENRVVVLLIDEAQKLNKLSLEILRGLLNYETNEHKLLQLLLIGQMELLPTIREIRNLWDRISLKYVLNPLDARETKNLIEFRLRKAGHHFSPPFGLLSLPLGPRFFTDEALKEIYNYTQGYPRRISMVCHDALKRLMMDNKSVVDETMIHDLICQEVR